ncbi:uncharacterized protein MKZ38_001533 [Zalerion maritima]|uniref:Uncharacterized protein n=1 Tax=Zalerion maritima TaxID=339359 RepID=A0AAD5RRQ7_9PEZI|nr:uncharacterized protein MKZ38_001533 [Zalerion maritima]
MLTSTAKFQSLAVRPEGPTSIADLLNSDEPQISLYVVTFLGATLVSISWSHCTMDGTAFSNLLTSWSAILNDGKPMEAFPELEDPVKDLGLKETPDHPLKGALLPFWSALAFVFRSVMDRLSDPGVESRTFFFPGEWVSDLRKQCLDDIIAAGLNAKIGSDSSSSNSKSPFISTNDVLLPYITKNYTTVNLAPKRPVAILSLADIRCRMPSAFSESMAYLSNLLILSPTFTTPEELSSHPLGLQAAKVREALVAQMSDEETVEGTLYMGRRMHEMLPLQKKAPYKTAIVLGSSDTFRTVVTNWDRMSFYDAVDFRSAVVDGCAEDGKEGGKRNEKGKPVHYFADTLSGGNNPWRHSWVIFGKDPEGDYWASGWLPRKTWETVEKDIRQGRLDTILGEL